MRSEFGQGLSYCLALFLCHSERPDMYSKEMQEKMSKNKACKDLDFEARNAEMWFNGASDHLYDLEIPETLPKSLQNRLKKLQKKVIHWGHGFKNDCTDKDKEWSIDEAKNLIRLIDKSYSIKTSKGQWQ